MNPVIDVLAGYADINVDDWTSRQNDADCEARTLFLPYKNDRNNPNPRMNKFDVTYTFSI